MFGYRHHHHGHGFGHGRHHHHHHQFRPFGFGGHSVSYGHHHHGHYNRYGGYGRNHYHHRPVHTSYGCNRLFGGGFFSRLFGGGCRYRSLDGSGGDSAPVDIFASYKGEVKPIAPYAFPNEYTGGKVKGLFIGINYVGQAQSELKGSCADVGIMIDTLEHIQFPMKEAAVLVDDPNFAGANGLPTRENILQHMLWLVKDAKAGDVLFFHYSGRSGEAPAATEGGSPSNTLIPSDAASAGVIADDDIFEILVRSLPEGVRMTIVMDCAEGSGMIDLPFAYVTSTEGAPQPKFGRKMAAEASYLKHQAKADVVMLCGVGGTNDGSGACTNSLAVAFRETAGLDYIGLTDAMKGTLDKHAIKQIPRLSSTKPMNLRSPFSLFGAVTADTHFYQTGSVDNAVAWTGPIEAGAADASPAAPQQPYTPGQQPYTPGQGQQPYTPGQQPYVPSQQPPQQAFNGVY